MRILVINCGSSSIKYQLFDMKNENVITKGLVERIGMQGSILTQKFNGQKIQIKHPMKNHKEAMEIILRCLIDEKYGILNSLDEITAVGHRVVHGGERYSHSVIVDEEVIRYIEECGKLAPLHNIPNAMGIKVCRELMPNIPMVTVFDTAFHQTMPKASYIYPVPYELYVEEGIRKYGFHGTSHKYVATSAAKILEKNFEDLNFVTCHIGNGVSVTAIKEGKSLDTSMGFTPLGGVCMGTRCGDIDPSIVTYIMKKKNLTVEEVENMMNKESGVLGLSGVSSDYRDIKREAEKGNEKSILALEIFANKIKQFIASYAVRMGKIDCIVFTGGIGENAPIARKNICNGLEVIGAILNKEKNSEVIGEEGVISEKNSKVSILVVPTNEELMIARECKNLILK